MVIDNLLYSVRHRVIPTEVTRRPVHGWAEMRDLVDVPRQRVDDASRAGELFCPVIVRMSGE
jgi:hypothetical protein